MKTIKPANNQLFCKPLKQEDKTASGLFLPSDSIADPQTAEVINRGEDVKQFKQGEIIVYKPYATVDIKLSGAEYFLIAEEDVLGVVVE
jgi:chaperonin GroES